MKREKLQIVSGVSDDIYKSVDTVFKKITEKYSILNKQENKLISLIFFVNENNDRFYTVRKYILEKAGSFFITNMPTISVIGQEPANGSDVLLEVEFLENIDEGTEVSYMHIQDGIYHTIVETHLAIEHYIFGVTIGNDKQSPIERVQEAYKILDATLNAHGLGMNDIVRQWNYVEDIVGFSAPEYGLKQNYQILNNIRHEYYSKYNFNKGFPAATGIGMSAGGFVLDCIAVKEKFTLEITPIKNPAQICAYDYSKKVLIGSKTENNFPRLSPKFERAKLYKEGQNQYSLLISGTAAIHNEESLAIGDAAKQTEITLQNITRLIESAVNVIEQSGKKIDNVSYPYLRVYIKNITDYGYVKNICNQYHTPVEPVYLIGDICREELLVEIEGKISFNVK